MNDSEGELLNIFSSLLFQKRIKCLLECFLVPVAFCKTMSLKSLCLTAMK